MSTTTLIPHLRAPLPGMSPPELPASRIMSPGFFALAFALVLVTSAFGIFCNVNLLFRFLTKVSELNGFQKLCTARSLANTIISATFCFWVVPLLAFGYTFSEVNGQVNRMICLACCYWAYFLNSSLQICLSCNRFYALYFPFGIKSLRSQNKSNYTILVCIVAVTSVCLAVPKGCGFVFDPNIFLVRDESQECAEAKAMILPPVVFSTTGITHAFNLAIILKLIKQKSLGIREEEARKRRRRWMGMFVQCATQDCLQLIDMLNCYYFSQLSDDLRLQFFTWTFSLIVVTALDGFVMFICNSDVHPIWLKMRLRKKMVVVHIVSKVSSIAVR